MDRNKVSARATTGIIASTAHMLGISPEELHISKSAVNCQRRKIHKEVATSIKEQFAPSAPLVVHWDSKLLPSLTGKQKEDRLAILVTGQDVDKLLAIPPLKDSKGVSQAEAVHDILQEWNLVKKVKCWDFDTTASTTGKVKGCRVVLQKKLNHYVLYLACRHHILELVLGDAYKECLGETTSPEVELFKKFQQNWPEINKSDVKIYSTDQDMKKRLGKDRIKILKFVKTQLKVSVYIICTNLMSTILLGVGSPFT